jgi:hypothetical protein
MLFRFTSDEEKWERMRATYSLKFQKNIPPQDSSHSTSSASWDLFDFVLSPLKQNFTSEISPKFPLKILAKPISFPLSSDWFENGVNPNFCDLDDRIFCSFSLLKKLSVFEGTQVEKILNFFFNLKN